MSGHSKWSNIQGRKNAQDAKRGKIFQKVSREIYMAAKAGGPDPAMNPALRLAVDKAKSANMPNDNIARAIKKASSAGEGEHYDEVPYEGYGPGGVAVLVHALTDNRNRTATNVRVAFTRNGGSLGETGSVNYMFDRKGYIVIKREDHAIEEDDMLEVVLGALAQAELTMVPQTLLTLNDEQKAQLERLVDKLEDDDDVSEVFTSAENL